MSGENTETLHLTQLQRESGGNYACGAQNSEGETRSTTLTLKVQCKLNSFIRLFFPHSYHYSSVPNIFFIC